nr:5820_t:CDS:2 [Entrophospora candida]
MDNDNNKDNLPYWGRVTATLDWCEENYNVHEYIAEFINTTTNFIFAYLYNQNPVFHQVSYAAMVSILNFRSYYMLSLVKERETQNLLKWLLFGSWIIFGWGFLVWNIDNVACHQLRTIRRNLEWPVVGHLLELHGWWHVGTAIGTYYWIVFNQYIRLISLNKDDNYNVVWDLGFLPRVAEIKKITALNKKQQ